MAAQKLPADIEDKYPNWNGRDGWKAAFKTRSQGIGLKVLAATVLDKAQANAFSTKDSARLVSELSKLGGGDPEVIQRWFERHPMRLDALAQALACTVSDLWADIGAGTTGAEVQPWHPAWPEVPADAVLVEPAFADPANWQQVQKKIVSTLATPAGVGNDGLRIKVIGKGHRWAARWIVESCVREAANGGSTVTHAEMVSAPAPESATVITIANSQERPTEVGLAPWGPTQVRGLACKLEANGAIDTPALANLAQWADRCDGEPGLLGPEPWPQALIGLAAAIAKEGPPKSAKEVRQHRTAASWKVASATEAGALLARHSEALMVHFWGERLATARNPDWRTLTAAEAETVATVVCPAPSIREAAELVRVVDVAKTSRSQHKEVLAALERSLTLGDPSGFVQRLVEASLLVRAGDRLRAADPSDALLWAARSGRPPSPAVVMDDGGTELAKEWAWSGLTQAQVAAAILSADDQLVVARTRCMLAYAVRARPSRAWVATHVGPAWHDLAYAGLFGVGDWTRIDANKPAREMWQSDLMLLQNVSVLFGHLLPPIDPTNPLCSLEAGRSPAFCALANKWHAAVAKVGGHVGPAMLRSYAEASEDNTDAAGLLRTLAVVGPGQVAPWQLAAPHDEIVARHLLGWHDRPAVLRALEGQIAARASAASGFAAGRRVTFQPSGRRSDFAPEALAQLWSSLPWELRLRELSALDDRDDGDVVRLCAILHCRVKYNEPPVDLSTEAFAQVTRVLKRCDPDQVGAILRPHFDLEFRAEFGCTIKTLEAIAVARALGRADLLARATTAGRQWLACHLPIISLGRLQWAPRARWPFFDYDRLKSWCGDAKGHKAWQAADAIAHAAAEALLAIGHPGEMRRRFSDGPDWLQESDRLEGAARIAALCRLHRGGNVSPEQLAQCPPAEALAWLAESLDPKTRLGGEVQSSNHSLFPHELVRAARAETSLPVFAARYPVTTARNLDRNPDIGDPPAWLLAYAQDRAGPVATAPLRVAYALLATWWELLAWPAGPFGGFLADLATNCPSHRNLFVDRFRFWVAEQWLPLAGGLPDVGTAIEEVRSTALATLLAARDDAPLLLWIDHIQSQAGEHERDFNCMALHDIGRALATDADLTDRAFTLAQGSEVARREIVEIAAKHHDLAWVASEVVKLPVDKIAELANWGERGSWLADGVAVLLRDEADLRVRLRWLHMARSHAHIGRLFSAELRTWFFAEPQPFSAPADRTFGAPNDCKRKAGYLDLLRAAKAELANEAKPGLLQRIAELLRLAAGLDDQDGFVADIADRFGRESAVSILFDWVEELGAAQIRMEFEKICAEIWSADRSARFAVSLFKHAEAWRERAIVEFADHRPDDMTATLREYLAQRAGWGGIAWAVDDVLAKAEAAMDSGEAPSSDHTWAIAKCARLPDRFVAKARKALTGPLASQWAAVFAGTQVEELLPCEVLAAFLSATDQSV